jgi:hypothetical protein
MKRSLTIIVITFLLTAGCTEIKTEDPIKIYKLWSGSSAPEYIQLLQGQYWQSVHWTKEYIMYLKLLPTENWLSEFLNQNQLKIDNDNWTVPTDAPSWFNPPNKSIRYKRDSNFDLGSRYFVEPTTGEMYIYEIQL